MRSFNFLHLFTHLDNNYGALNKYWTLYEQLRIENGPKMCPLNKGKGSGEE